MLGRRFRVGIRVLDGVIRIVSWNIARRSEAWQSLLDSGVDVGLLQKAQRSPPELERQIEIDPAPWNTADTPVIDHGEQ